MTAAVGPLLGVLKDRNGNIRSAAAEALGEINNPQAVEPLMAALKDSDWLVRDAAASALGRIKDARAVGPLVAALKDSDGNVRRAAASALEELKYQPSTEQRATLLVAKRDWAEATKLGATVVEPLLGALKDSDSDVRRAGTEALVKLGAAAVEPLVRALKDGDWDTRQAAAGALGQVKDARSVEPLIGALMDNNGNVRSAAAAALGEIKDPQAVEPLAATLKDSDSWVRRAAAEALGQIGDKRAVAALAAALPDWGNRWAIGWALLQLGWQPQTDREVVYLRICKEETAALTQDWEKTRRILLEDVLSRDRRKIDNTVFTFISLGREDIIWELLKILDEHGDKEMAETYLNCGHQRLARAAEAWAYRRGYEIFKSGVGSGAPSWGAWH